ncbi:MAG: hypothetical protein PHW02_04385 [bacterium]|nr:hypothetical protein [bacterium]
MKEKRLEIESEAKLKKYLKMSPHVTITLPEKFAVILKYDEKGRLLEEAFFEQKSGKPIEITDNLNEVGTTSSRGIHKYAFEYTDNSVETATMDSKGEYIEDAVGVAAKIVEFNRKRGIEITSYCGKTGEIVPMSWIDNSIYYILTKKDKEGRVALEVYFDKEQMLTKNSSNKAYAVVYGYKKASKKPYAEALCSHNQIVGGYKIDSKGRKQLEADEIDNILSINKLTFPLPRRMYEWILKLS